VDKSAAVVAPESSAAAGREVWPLVLTRRVGDSPLYVAIITASLAALLPLCNFIYVLPDPALSARTLYESVVTAGVNVLVIGYCAGLLGWVLRRLPDDLHPLRALLSTDPDVFIRGVCRALNGRECWAVIAIATLVWYLVNIQFGSLGRVLRGEIAASAINLWNVPFFFLLWALLIYTAMLLFRLANQMCELGRRSLRIDLLATHRLTPFMDISQRTILLAVGGLSLTLVQRALLGGIGYTDWVPATVLVVLLSGWLLLRPMWGVYLAIRAARDAELARLDAVIGYHDTRSVEQLCDSATEHLQRHRERILAVSVWPITNMSWWRPVLYFVIPPLAWVAAALVETLVDTNL
jgi:hypothetical protein